MKPESILKRLLYSQGMLIILHSLYEDDNNAVV